MLRRPSFVHRGLKKDVYLRINSDALSAIFGAACERVTPIMVEPFRVLFGQEGPYCASIDGISPSLMESYTNVNS